jgi:hypothetical protein
MVRWLVDNCAGVRRQTTWCLDSAWIGGSNQGYSSFVGWEAGLHCEGLGSSHQQIH